jgi:thioredoxin-dependent peroxiredoxin
MDDFISFIWKGYPIMTAPAEGKTAPAFSLPASNGETVALKDFKGKQNVILFFYPRDNTPGCTQEACDFRDNQEKFQARDTVILGVSRDSMSSHNKFISKFDLPFILLSDESEEVCKKYDVIKEKNMYGKKVMGIVRSTFLIGKDGKIKKIFSKVKVEGHAQAVLDALNELP